VDKRFIDDLAQVNKYQIFVLGKNDKEKGTFYLDDLTVSYLPQIQKLAVQQNKYIPALLKQQKSAKPLLAPLLPAANGSIQEIPYLQVEINPNPALQGSKISAKVNMPNAIEAQEVIITWGLMNRNPLTTKLVNSGQVWKGVWQIPNSYKTGEQFGMVFVKTAQGVFKKQFIYRVLAAGQNSPVEYINCLFYPHPLIPQKEAVVKVSIPEVLNPKTVGIFFGESKSKIYSSELKKVTSAGGRGSWQGGISLPKDIVPGSYSAVIYIKTQDNRIIRREAFYAVSDNTAQ